MLDNAYTTSYTLYMMRVQITMTCTTIRRGSYMETNQEKLNKACKNASGDGVGWIGVIDEKDGSVTLRGVFLIKKRDEEYALSHDAHYATLDIALAYLAEENI